jgi:hypothetical protein
MAGPIGAIVGIEGRASSIEFSQSVQSIYNTKTIETSLAIR